MTGRFLVTAMLVLGAAGAAAEDLAMLPLGDPQRACTVASLEAGGFYDCTVGETPSLEEAADILSGARVVRSVFRQPLADGTVEITCRRDGDGTVVEVSRLDRSGTPAG